MPLRGIAAPLVESPSGNNETAIGRLPGQDGSLEGSSSLGLGRGHGQRRGTDEGRGPPAASPQLLRLRDPSERSRLPVSSLLGPGSGRRACWSWGPGHRGGPRRTPGGAQIPALTAGVSTQLLANDFDVIRLDRGMSLRIIFNIIPYS